MAETKLKLKVDAGVDVFYVFDKTGAYSSQNTTGWGLPNSVIANVTSAVVRVFLPDAETFTAVDVTPVLPTTNGPGFEIVPSDLSLDTFPPGIYKFQYYITLSGGIILSQIVYFFHYIPLECCISKKKSKTSLNDADSPEAIKALELELLLENAIWAACAGDIDAAKENSDYIWSQCNCCGC